MKLIRGALFVGLVVFGVLFAQSAAHAETSLRVSWDGSHRGTGTFFSENYANFDGGDIWSACDDKPDGMSVWVVYRFDYSANLTAYFLDDRNGANNSCAWRDSNYGQGRVIYFQTCVGDIFVDNMDRLIHREKACTAKRYVTAGR